MIFPVIECERTVRVGDKTRLSGLKSFVTKGDAVISKVEVCPDYVPGGQTTVPITLNGNGRFSESSGTIYDVTGIDFDQLRGGMTIISGFYDIGIEASILSFDRASQSITTDSFPTSNANGSFQVTGTITQDNSPVFINVNGRSESDWYLDWIYPGDTRNVVAAVRVTSGQASEVAMKTINVLSATDDIVFSTDDDLEALEPNITRFTPDGRNSFLNVHREARNKILEALSDEGVRNGDGTSLKPAILTNYDEVMTWSRDLTLSLIFQGMIKESGDVFSVKTKYYADQANLRSERAFLTLSVPQVGNDPFRSSQVATLSLCR